MSIAVPGFDEDTMESDLGVISGMLLTASGAAEPGMVVGE